MGVDDQQVLLFRTSRGLRCAEYTLVWRNQNSSWPNKGLQPPAAIKIHEPPRLKPDVGRTRIRNDKTRYR